MSNIPRVLIVSRYDEDQKNILAVLGEQDFFIVGVEKDEASAIIKSERLKPDVLILDLQLSVMNYSQLARIIRRRSPSTAVIILSETEDKFSFHALQAGISGFLLKKEDINKLALVVKLIFMGGYFINTSVTSGVFRKAAKINQFPQQADQFNHLILSPVERGIITYLANGLSDYQIAKHLNYSEGSIKNILTIIKRKTKMKNRTQVVVFALVSGFIFFEHLWMWNEESS